MITKLRRRQLDLLTNDCGVESIEEFYKDAVKLLEEEKILKTDCYRMFTDLFEDCPE